ncbi:MAG TPA: hypothetical protein PL024_12350 [Thauera sp.]|nr:hypothetical protein [Thauera sp.]HRA82280.1 hypothetical protein [Thauera sp.]
MTAPTHAADVLSYLRLSAEGFSQLAAILKTIENEAKDDRRLLALAGAGRHIADDLEEMAGCWHDEVKERGIRTG